MTDPNALLSLKAFGDLHFQSPTESRIQHVEGCWRARCIGGFLATPDGSGKDWPSLELLLSTMASDGIRRMDIEWDDLPPSSTGRSGR